MACYTFCKGTTPNVSAIKVGIKTDSVRDGNFGGDKVFISLTDIPTELRNRTLHFLVGDNETDALFGTVNANASVHADITLWHEFNLSTGEVRRSISDEASDASSFFKNIEKYKFKFKFIYVENELGKVEEVEEVESDYFNCS